MIHDGCFTMFIVAIEHEPKHELHYADRTQIGETFNKKTGDAIKSLRNHGASDGPFLKFQQMSMLWVCIHFKDFYTEIYLL